MKFEEIVKNCIAFPKMHFSNAEEVIDFLSKQLTNKGIVKNEFSEAVLNREKKYPTGLQLGDINVAIPHTDVDHVLKSGIAIATLTTPVFFNRMDDPSTKVPVNIVFVLAVSNPKEYVKFLSKLTTSFGKDHYMEELLKAEDPDEIKKVLKKILDGEEK